MSMFQQYYGAIHVTDGKEGLYEQFDRVVGYKKGVRTIIDVAEGKFVSGIKVMKGSSVIEWEKFGAFHRGYKTFNGKNISAPVIMRYAKKSIRALNGICERWDQKLFGNPGKCRTMYSRGRLLCQEFRYRNGRLAYRLNATDRFTMVRHPDGSRAAVIGCSGGLSTRSGTASARDTHTCRNGEMYFNGGNFERGDINTRKQDYSKDGNCSFNFWDKNGRLYSQGEYSSRQKVGEWVVAGKHVYFINGIMVGKKLWETPPAKLKVKTILKIKNAQMRAALINRMGYERFSRDCKSKVIHEDTRKGMKLMEFPVKVDDGNRGRHGSNLRLLQVTCPSTKHLYFLNVPDFVWDGGKRTKLNTCEQSRQWTFHVDDPRKKIEFAIET